MKEQCNSDEWTMTDVVIQGNERGTYSRARYVLCRTTMGSKAHPGYASVAWVLVTSLRLALYRNAPHLEDAERKRDDDNQHQPGNQRLQEL